MPESATTLDPAVPATTAAVRTDLTSAQLRLLDILRNIGGPLFAILDAARDDRILQILAASGEEHQSLYAGLQGEILAPYAPYLVRLPADSPLLKTLIAEGWGQSWGICLVSGADWKTLRKHFRTFLMVKLPDAQTVYFRYYDPRVLRLYLPTCDADESRHVFGPISAFLCESAIPSVLNVFQPGDDMPRIETVSLIKALVIE